MSEYPSWAKARHEFATEVAKHLRDLTDGQQWHVEQLPAVEDVWNFTSIYLKPEDLIITKRHEPDRPTIHLNGDGWRGWNEDKRVVVSGFYPRYNGHDGVPYGESRPRITCAVKRGTLAVAKDIARRFLSDYLTLYETCEGRSKSTRKYDEGKRAALKQVAKAFEVEPRHRLEQSNQDKTFSVGSVDVLWGQVDEYKPGSVKIELRDCPVELAVDIGRLVRQYLDKVGHD